MFRCRSAVGKSGMRRRFLSAVDSCLITFVVGMLLMSAEVMSARRAMAGEDLCSDWSNISSAVRGNLQILEAVNPKLSDKVRSYNTSNQVGVRFVNMPSVVESAIRNIIDSSVGYGNFQVTYNVPQKSEIIFIYYDADNALDESQLNALANFIKSSFDLNSVPYGKADANAWIQDSLNQSRAFAASPRRGPVMAGSFAGADGSNLIARLSFISPKDNNPAELRSHRGKVDLALNVFGDFGIPGQIIFRNSMFSASSADEFPTHVDLAMLRIMSISGGISGWRHGYAVASDACSSGGHF